MRCPTCERDFQPADSPALPFCSDRCRLIDLGRWNYADARLVHGYMTPADIAHWTAAIETRP